MKQSTTNNNQMTATAKSGCCVIDEALIDNYYLKLLSLPLFFVQHATMVYRDEYVKRLCVFYMVHVYSIPISYTLGFQ